MEVSQDIQWRVAIPFRLLHDQDDLKEFVANKDERHTDNPIQSAEERLAKDRKTRRDNTPYYTPYEQTEWQLAGAKGVALNDMMTYNKQWLNPETHKIKVRMAGGFAHRQCKWPWATVASTSEPITIRYLPVPRIC